MKINNIYYNQNFKDQFLRLPRPIQQKTLKAEGLFRANPFHPSLRLHKLSGKLMGLWSLSIDIKYRLIFRPVGNGDIFFVSIGIHAIYDKTHCQN